MCGIFIITYGFILILRILVNFSALIILRALSKQRNGLKPLTLKKSPSVS